MVLPRDSTFSTYRVFWVRRDLKAHQRCLACPKIIPMEGILQPVSFSSPLPTKTLGGCIKGRGWMWGMTTTKGSHQPAPSKKSLKTPALVQVTVLEYPNLDVLNYLCGITVKIFRITRKEFSPPLPFSVTFQRCFVPETLVSKRNVCGFWCSPRLFWLSAENGYPRISGWSRPPCVMVQKVLYLDSAFHSECHSQRKYK